MTDFLNQIQEHWVMIAGSCSVIFFLYRIRAEETLRTKLKLINECYDTFANLNDAVQDWAQPIITGTVEESNKAFMVRLGKFYEEAQSKFHHAAVLMRPETNRSLNKVFVLIGLIRAEYTNWQMFKSNEGFPKELQKAFDNARKNLPKELQATTEDLLTDFQIIAHGPLKLLWWKVTGRCYPCLRDSLNQNLKEAFDQDRKDILKSLK